MITRPKIYTQEFVSEECRKILEMVLEDKEIVYIGQVFEILPYPRQVYSTWAKDFRENREISDTIKRIDDILESRVNVGGLKGKLNSTMSIFNLKNNYGWKDSFENSHSGGIPVQIVNYQPPQDVCPSKIEDEQKNTTEQDI